MTGGESSRLLVDPWGRPDRGASGGRGLLVVAHPDDETLWAGGLMLMRSDWSWTVVALCRGSDPDRRPRFFSAVERLGATGRIADLDDGPAQSPLPDSLVRETVMGELDESSWDLVITHGPRGEYTRHRRHEEVSASMQGLWRDDLIDAEQMWMFAYSDQGGSSLPAAIDGAHVRIKLPEDVWREKLSIVEGIYGFSPGSWEYEVTPREEAFWRLRSGDETSGPVT